MERSDEKRTGKMLLTAALAGGIASCVSTVALFPLDTLKTRLQSTAGASIQSIARTAPEIGVRGLYRLSSCTSITLGNTFHRFCVVRNTSEEDSCGMGWEGIKRFQLNIRTQPFPAES